ncbi:MAG: SpoIIE family protein phosphatase [Flavobacteriales bacterium]
MRFGSLGHLLFYDGNSWRKHFVKKGMAIASTASDPEDPRIWIGGQGDLGYFQRPGKDRASNEVGFISLRPELPDPNMRIKMVWNTLRVKGRVFFNDFRHLFAYDGEELKVFEPNSPRFYHAFKLDNTVLVQDSAFRIYHEASKSLRRLDGSEALAPYSVSAVLSWSEEKVSVKGVSLPDSLLVATKRNGLFFYLPKAEKLIPFASSLKERIKELGVQTAALLPPSRTIGRARMVLGTITGGVLFLDQSGKAVLQLDQKKGLENDLIWDLYYDDAQGVLWVSTNKGISRLETMSRVTHAREGEAFQGKVLDLLKLGDHTAKKGRKRLLFLATSQGCYKMERPDNSLIPRTKFGLIPGTAGQCIDMLRTGEHEFLITQRHLLRVHKKNGEWTGSSFDRRNFYKLEELPGKEQVFAAAGSDGLLLFKKKGGRSKDLAKPLDHLEGISSMLAFGKEQDRMLWVGTTTNGLYRIHPSSEEGWEDPKVFHSDSSDGLPAGPVRVFEWREAPILGTSNGLFKPEKGKSHASDELSFVRHSFQRKAFDGNLKERAVFQFHSFTDSSFWIQSGKFQYCSLQNGNWHRDSNSLTSRPLRNIRTVLEDSARNGIAWIGHDNGLTRYNRNIEESYNGDYPCLIRKVHGIRKREEGHKKEDTLLYEGQGSKIQAETPLPFARNELSFQFAAPYFRREKSTEYRYRLVGYEAGWSEWGKQTRKEYTNITEGFYTFKVQARNAFWKKSRVGRYRFRVLPPWYRTWWAYGAYGVSGGIFVLLLVRLNGRRLRKQKERLEKIVRERTQEIRQQKEQVEAAHQEINDSIDYAQRIQDALLQSEEYVSTHLPAHFILFKPQARVSGDFYWASEKEGYLYFAAMDCTGHGVPGAFMSMLGVAFLNDILSHGQGLDPGEVLNELRDRVMSELASSQEMAQLKDGMDAALLCIELDDSKNTREVRFAGANNPLYVIRKGIAEDPPPVQSAREGRIEDRLRPFKGSSDGIEIKGDPFPVGYDENAGDSFRTHSLELRRGDMLYIFSDGYADQFGGEKGKKFRYRPFKQLLADIHEKPLEAQKEELDRTFEDWKNASNQEQIDDVVVIGLRL